MDHKEIKRSQSNPKLYDSYLGIYDMSSIVMSIVREGDRLFAQINGQKKRSLMEWAMRWQEPPAEGSEIGRCRPMKARAAVGSCSALSGRRERTDRNVISVRISERELLGLSVRITCDSSSSQ